MLLLAIKCFVVIFFDFFIHSEKKAIRLKIGLDRKIYNFSIFTVIVIFILYEKQEK